MQDHSRFAKGSIIWPRFVLAFLAIAIASVLVAEVVVSVVLPLWSPEAVRGVHVVLVMAIAAVVWLAIATWAGRPAIRRLQRVLEVSRAWLRGNLSARIADAKGDELGLLAEQLDLLAEHLEQDEEDLAELRERNARLADQVRALAVVEERNRLARELHDSVKQYLFSLAMMAGGLRTRFEALLASSDEARDELIEVVDSVREVEANAQTAQREITRLIKDLRPGSLEEQGLAAALNDYALLFGAREHVLAYVDVQGNDTLLVPPVAEALYRVAQEALHNVARHARATRVDVRLRCLPEQAILTVRDNGVGFDTQQPHRGLGMSNMQERIMDVGGQLSVESRLGRGTTVTAKVVLAQPVAARTQVTVSNQQRPKPRIENWAWLGQRLVIPVGQTWPWPPADRVHLRQPLVEPVAEALLVVPSERVFGRKGFDLKYELQRLPLARVRRTHWGYEWRQGSAAWTLRYVGGTRDRMVLSCNAQPLAALQSQGRLMNAWSEVVYDGRGYRLACTQERGAQCTFVDEAGQEIVTVKGGSVVQVDLRRAIPLPLLVLVAARTVDDVLWVSNQGAE